MPRSWQSTEPAAAQFEIVDLKGADPRERIASDRFGSDRLGGPRWRVWVVAAAAIAAGMVLLPDAEEPVDHTVAIDSLPELPAATTITTLPRASVAVMGKGTFPLIPVSGLAGYGSLTEPVLYRGSYWVAASASFGSERVVMLASEDGVTWSPRAELPNEVTNIRVDDLGVYGDVLMALGIGTADPVAESPGGMPEAIMLWKTTDGVNWREELVKASDDRHRYLDLDLVTGDHAVLIRGYEDLAVAPYLQEALPPAMLVEMARGTLSYWIRPLSPTTSSVVVVAPPGIEVFSVEIPVALPPDGTGWVIRSETLAAWQRLETDFPIGSMVAWPGHGFVAGGYDRPLLSEDGRDWVLSPDLPPAQYQTWNGALLGTHGPFDHLIIETSNGLATVELPPEINMIDRLREGWVDFLAGPGGLAAVRSMYGQSRSGTMSVVSGEITISVSDGGILRAGRGNDPRWAIALGPESVPGIFDLDTRQVTVKPLGTNESFTLNLDDLQAFWNPVGEPARHEIYVSADGLVWSQGQAALLSERVVSLIGGAADTFLLGISREAQPGQFSPAMTVYRTGPVG
jgi:hypothetical protein